MIVNDKYWKLENTHSLGRNILLKRKKKNSHYVWVCLIIVLEAEIEYISQIKCTSHAQASEFLSINSLTDCVIILSIYNNDIEKVLIITYISKNLLIEIQRPVNYIKLWKILCQK